LRRASDGFPQMIFRNRFLITAAGLCHLLLALLLVTSRLHAMDEAAATQEKNAAQSTPATPCVPQANSESDATVLCALEQEKQGAVYKLRGQAEIHYGTYILHADEVTYDSDTGEATAEGHFVLDGGPNDEHIKASHGTYNFTAETGRFYDVTGTTGLRFRGSRVVLTSTAPFSFTGKTVEKTSPDHYAVYDGTITTCEMPQPNWEFGARKILVDVGGNARIYRSFFELHGVPVLYLPFATHPVQREARESGFLMPSIGRSSTKGNIVGEAFYWAINRSMDATIGAEYFSKRGWSQHGEFRAQPSETSYLDLNYFGVMDRGIGTPPVQQGGENARLNAGGSLFGFRGVANVDYLSSFLFRLAFNEVFSQAVYSEVKSQGFLAKSTNGFSLNGMMERYQNFESTVPGNVITISHAPSLDVSSVDRELGRSPFYWSFDAEAGGLARSEPGFRTGNLLGRFDLNPEISLPLLFEGWSLRPELILHDTFYTERFIPTEVGGLAQNNSINRRALETTVELRPPAVERVFNREFLGRRWKHVIEPIVKYRYVNGVNDFSHILRFDERDILSDTNEVEYGFTARLYAKRTTAPADDCKATGMGSLAIGAAGAGGSAVPWAHSGEPQPASCLPGPEVQEVATWEVAQKYFIDPTFGGALVPGQRNVFSTTADLTGIAFLTASQRFSPLISRLRVATGAHTDTEWDLDYDFQQGRVNASTLLVNYHSGPFTLGGGDAFLQPPLQSSSPFTTATREFHQFRVALGYGVPNKRGFSGASSFGFDAESGFLQFASAQTTYNWGCCGFNLEYRRYAIASVRNENQFRFTFTLANVGSFGNLRRQERLY
jgi:LPS-assembly protein